MVTAFTTHVNAHSDQVYVHVRTQSHTHYVKFVLPLSILLVLCQLLEVGGVGTPQLHLSLRPHCHHPVGDGEDDGTYRVPLGGCEGVRVRGRVGVRV